MPVVKEPAAQAPAVDESDADAAEAPKGPEATRDAATEEPAQPAAPLPSKRANASGNAALSESEPPESDGDDETGEEAASASGDHEQRGQER